MCIIVCKPFDAVGLKKNVIKNCFDNNDDGAGLGYVIRGQQEVVINKGFLSYDKLQSFIDKLFKKYDEANVSMILHFRIGTSGLNNESLTHPFTINNDNKLKDNCSLACCMNGVIPWYKSINNNTNDTMFYCKNILKFYPVNFYKDSKILNDIKNITNSKWAFIDSTGEIYTTEGFTVDNGILYSNDSYKKSYYDYYSYNYDIKHDCKYNYTDDFIEFYGYIETDTDIIDTLKSDDIYYIDDNSNVYKLEQSGKYKKIYYKKLYDDLYNETSYHDYKYIYDDLWEEDDSLYTYY